MPNHALSSDKVKRLAAFLVSRAYSSKAELANALRISRTTVDKYTQLLEKSGYAMGDIGLLLNP